MTKPDSTDAGGVTEDREQWLLQQSQFTNAEVNRMLDRAEKAESALATLTRENAELKTRNDALESDLDFLANHMTTDWTNRTDVGGKAMLRMKATLDQAAEPATPPAPLPGDPRDSDGRQLCGARYWGTRSWWTCDLHLGHQGDHSTRLGGDHKTRLPLPGGQGQVEALRREIVEALRVFIEDIRPGWGNLPEHVSKLVHRLEQGGEGREG